MSIVAYRKPRTTEYFTSDHLLDEDLEGGLIPSIIAIDNAVVISFSNQTEENRKSDFRVEIRHDDLVRLIKEASDALYHRSQHRDPTPAEIAAYIKAKLDT